MKRICLILFLLFSQIAFSQNGILCGKISDTHGSGISYVAISCEANSTSTYSKEDGSYQIEIPQNKKVTVYFSKIGYFEHTTEITLTNEKKTYSPTLQINVLEIPKIKVSYDKEAEENVTHLSAERASSLPGLSLSGIEGGLKTFAGVTSKSELSSQYSVRGGSYDENLVYINGVPAYKPTMARSDKQEGLSIINPYMVDNVEFSSGGFDICYGDKMSSVLNVTYKDVDNFQIQTDASFMDMNITAQGVDKSNKISIIAGGRYKNTSRILKTLDEIGEYKPIFFDIQSLLRYKISPKLTLSYWIYGAKNSYRFQPDKRVTDFGSQAKSYRMTIYFEGGEKYIYQNLGNSLSLNYRPNQYTNLNFKALYYNSNENETFDVLSQYRLSESFNDGDKIVEDSTSILAVGSFLEHGRNNLKMNNLTFMHDGQHLFPNFFSINWGASVSISDYDANYNEWTYIDSANYVLPYCDTAIILKNVANSHINHNQTLSAVYAGFSKRFFFDNEQETSLKLHGGIRMTYDTYSEKFLMNPRAKILLRPSKNKTDRISFATGIYYQPAEFKELIDNSGQFYSNIKPQKSTHFVLGYSKTIQLWNRPFFWNTESYIKILKNIIPYTIDNVSIAYYPDLLANGHIVGLDTKLNGEFVPGVESWINFSIMSAKEHLQGTSDSEIRRANDQLLSFSMFFQDYLPGSERLKMNLTFMAGTNIPTAAPNATYMQFDDYTISPYTRLDLGFLFVLIDSNLKQTPSKIKNLALGLEIFNLFDNANKISYFWIEDVSKKYFAVPNYLTSRRLNLKLTMKI